MTRSPRLPGRWLAQLARIFFSDDVLRSVVYPALADFQHEALTAESRRERLRARLHGYWAFWKLVGIAPFALGHKSPAQQAPRGFLPVTVLVVGVMVLFVGWRPWMSQQLGALFDLLPEGGMTTVGQFSGLAFLAGPLAIVAILAVARGRFPVRLPEVTLLALLSVVAAAVLSTAAAVGAFQDIGREGSAGVGMVVGAMTSSVAPLSAGIAAFMACLAVMAVVAFALRSHEWPGGMTGSGSMPAAVALGLSVLVVASVLSIDQFLRAHREFTEAIVMLVTPVRPGSMGLGARAAQQEEVALTLLSWGAFLTVMLPIAGFSTWRASRSRRAHALFTWTTRVAVIAAIATSTMHLRAIQRDLESFDQRVAEMRAMNPRHPR
jgi:hypothetical protein